MQTLTILHTNDLHAEYDVWVRLASLIRQRQSALRAAGEPFLLLDGGDHLDISVPECLLTAGQLNMDLLAELGYHASGVGNNELARLTEAQVTALTAYSPVPWVLTNVRDGQGQGIGEVHTELLLTLEGGLTIGLAGLTDPIKGEYDRIWGYSTSDSAASIRAAAARLRAQGAERIVVLSHEGYARDQELAREWSGVVDIIVGAHSHTVLPEPELVAGVVIVQAGSHGRYLGEVCLEWDADGALVAARGLLHPLTESTPIDAGQAQILAAGRERCEAIYEEVLTVLDKPLSHDEVVTWTAEVMRDFYEAEIGLMIGAVATGGFPAGPLTFRAVFETLRSLICVTSFEMQGRQIRGLLEENRDTTRHEHRLFGNGMRPKNIPLGKLYFAGVTEDEQGITVNGAPLDLDRWYKVGTGEHLFYGKTLGYPSLNGSRALVVDDFMYIRDAFIAALRKQQVTI